MNGVWRVVRWETMRHLRNKQFLIGLFVTPIIMALFATLPMLMNRFDTPREMRYDVVDRLGAVSALQESLAGSAITVVATSAPEPELAERVRSGQSDGYFVLDGEFAVTGAVQLHVTRPDRMRHGALQSALSALLRQLRIDAAGIDRAQFDLLTAPASLVPTALDDPEQTAARSSLPMVIFFSAMLFLLIFSSGAMLLQSALQEKRDRMSEVVLSSVSPSAFMAGKIIGHFLLGVFQIVVWLVVGIPAALFLLDIPVFNYVVPELLPICLLFTLGGYLFFAALFVGIGATMEDLQSASNSQGMVFMLPILSFLTIGPIVGNPDGIVARIATLLPLTSPLSAMFRLGFTDVPTWELVLSLVLLLLGAAIATRLAAKLFRVGMLMYGKNASLQEIWKWLRHAE